MGTRTLKFCYDLSLQKSSLPLDKIDLCDVAHKDFHGFSLETRSILATVCANKHSTWHASHSCVTNLCNGASTNGRLRWKEVMVTAVSVMTWFAMIQPS